MEIEEIEAYCREKLASLRQPLIENLAAILLGERIPLDVCNAATGEILIPAGCKITMRHIKAVAANSGDIELDPSPIQQAIVGVIAKFQNSFSRELAAIEHERQSLISQLPAYPAFQKLEALATTGDPIALYKLGIHYLTGEFGRDSAKARDAFEQAAKQGHIEALIAIGDYESAASRGSVKALELLGDCYSKGCGSGTTAFKKAVECYKECAGKGSLDAQYKLACLHWDHGDLKNGKRVALDWFYRAAKSGHPNSQTKLGDYWSAGRTAWHDLHLYVCEAASNAIHVKEPDCDSEQHGLLSEHPFNNGFCSRCGCSIDEVVTFALRCDPAFSFSSIADDREEIFKKSELAQAAVWYAKAAEQGDLEAMVKLGHAFRDGWVHSRRPSENAQGSRNKQAVKLYRQAAEQGHEGGMRMLGYCYELGIGVAQSETQAAIWYRAACAFEELGDLYAQIGDKKKAAKAYRLAGFHARSSQIRNLGPRETW